MAESETGETARTDSTDDDTLSTATDQTTESK